MNVLVNFKSGKSITKRGATGFKMDADTYATFKNQDGSTYRAKALLIFYGKGKTPTHYKQSVVKDVSEVE